MSEPLVRMFADLRDSRVTGRCKHQLLDIVLIVLCGTLAGADDFLAIADFAKSKQKWLRERLGLQLPNGLPSHDTLNRVFALIEPEAFQACFGKWVRFASETLTIPQIAIDGKVMRGTRKGATPALTIVSAWASEAGLTLAQVQAEEKSNEITALPELLALLDLSGALVTIDAAGCQKSIAASIVEKGGDYLLAVKENQPRLSADIDRLFLAALEKEFAGLSQHTIEETGHGRSEMRFCIVIEDVESIRDRAVWKDLRSVVCVVSSRTIRGKTSDERRYFISSRKASARTFLARVRGHWGIENGCHWVLDVAFGEDDHRLREGHAPHNMALVRKMALAMLKKAKAKCGIRNKRLKAGWDDTFLEHVLRDFLDD
jgi:predicted transposase YbfD/YdcC